MNNLSLVDETLAIKVLIVEDFPLIRDGFHEILKKVEGLEIAATAESAEVALTILDESKIDVVLMDIRLPGMDGDEATRVIKERWPDVKVIALTTYGDRGFIQKMLREGASGYMLKDSERSELVKAIFAVHKGENYFSNKVSNILLKSYLPQSKSPTTQSGFKVSPDELTRRERDVLRLICQEMTNREIADSMCVSVRTVDSHRRNLLMKIDARNTAGLVKYALRHGLDQEEIF